jgi:hypothetical protein
LVDRVEGPVASSQRVVRQRPQIRAERRAVAFFGVNTRQICLYADMLNRLLRYLVTSTVLLTMAVAGMPIIVCVSEAHGAMIEVGRMHLDDSKPSANHHTLFGQVEKSAQSQPCSDFQLERGTIAKQKREQQPSSQIASSGGTPFVASAPPSLRTTRPLPVTIRAFAHMVPSSLRERRTIVLLI